MSTPLVHVASGGDAGRLPLDATAVLSTRDLRVRVHRRDRPIDIVRGISIDLARGEVLGMVGESGSGKSMTALAILGLQPSGAERTGQVSIAGNDVSQATEGELERIRGSQVGVVFQDPLTSLNPVMPVGRQIGETLITHLGLSRRAAADRATELLSIVGIPDAVRRAGDVPGTFSGGMRQRVMIAMAVACEPPLLIADEPTSALDVTVQAQILDVLMDLRDRLGLALLLITHDLGVVAAVADRVAVVYAGRIVELGSAGEVLERAVHPYTRALLAATPRIDLPATAGQTGIAGTPPDPAAMPEGCPFRPRCGSAFEPCHREPSLLPARAGHEAACWLVAPSDSIDP